jgi:tetratricopeptide (TPR) repeat protein
MIVPALSRTWLRLAILAGLLGLLAVVAVLLLFDARPDWLFRATLDDRLEGLRTAVAIFADNWLTGAGPYTHLLLDDVYADRDSGVVVLVHVHNVYAQTLSDLGIIGAAAMVFSVCLAGRVSLAAWRSSGHKDRLYVAAAVAAVGGFMVHGLSESPPSWNAVFVPLGLVLALIARMAPPPVRLQKRAWLPRAAVLALVPVTLFTWWAVDAAHQHYERSLIALEKGDLDRAAFEAGRAADADRSLYAYAIHAGVLRVWQYQLGEESTVTGQSLLDEGIAHLRRATRIEPYSSLAYANLALALQLAGDTDGAVTAARMAVIHDPGSEDVSTAAGTVLEAAGLRNEAVDAYARAVYLDPNLAHAPFWATAEARAGLRAEVIARSGVDACEVGKTAALYGVGMTDLPRLASECASLVEVPKDAVSTARLSLIYFRLGQLDEARALASQARAIAPGNREVALATAIVLSENPKQARFGLLKATAIYDRDAANLLLATYLPELAAAEGISLPMEREPAPIPAVLDGLVPAHDPETIVPAGAPTGARSFTYYRWGALREAPPIVLIPGDWATMDSPRTILALEIGEALYEPDNSRD